MIYLVAEKSKEGKEKEKEKKGAGILETPIWKTRMYLQVCDFLETEGQENLDFLGNQTEKRKVKKTAEKKDNKNGERWFEMVEKSPVMFAETRKE